VNQAGCEPHISRQSRCLQIVCCDGWRGRALELSH
jgi:hypothetical protein